MIFYLKVHFFPLNKNIAFISRIILTILVVPFVLIILSGCQYNKTEKHPQKAINGKLELSGWNFKNNGSVRLDGQWEFYWSKLLNPSDFKLLTTNYKKNIITVPSTWKGYKLDNTTLPDEGYATYRLIVNLDYAPKSLALNTTAFIASCRIWIDSEEIYTAGKVANKSDVFTGSFKPQTILIYPKSNQFQIIVQISNFGFANGGFVTSLELGDAASLINKKNTHSYIDIFLFSSIFIIGIYHFTLYILRKKDYSPMYFGIICLLISIRVLLMGDMLLYKLIPTIELNIFLKLSMITIYLGLAFFVMFFHTIFPEDTPIWFVKFSQAAGLFFTIITIVTTDKFNDILLIPFEIIGIVILILLLKILVKAILSKKEASILVLIALLSIIAFSINDILNSYSIISTGYYIPLGLFVFIFVQSIMLSRKYEKAFYTVKLQENQLLKSELRMLQAQIKPHFLFNTLNTIISVCRVSSDKAEELLLNLSNYLRCGFSFKNDEEFVDFETELLHVTSYLAIEKERFLDKLNIVYDIEDNIRCKMPPYIIQPIVENSVKHGILPLDSGGIITLTVKKKDATLTIIVKDTGTGIDQYKLASILNNTYEKAGIGLLNVRNRLQKIYGNSLTIESIKGEGTVVTIIIPLEANKVRNKS